MPFFHLHIFSEGHLILGEEPLELADLAAAHQQAISGLRSMISADVLTGKLRLDEYIQVHDALGQHVSTVRFSDAVEVTSPALTARGRAANDFG
jgi:hypothetical protein